MQTHRGHSFWFWLGWTGGLFLLFAALLWTAAWYTLKPSTASAGFNGFGSGGNIAVVDLKGVILSADKTDTQLEKFANDDSVKAIILHIDSPGGGAAASQEIYHEVLRIRSHHKKRIVASIESVGASGAYYIASATDRIYANQASIVGSVGVIMEWVNYGDLLKWAKLKSVIIKAGALKDAAGRSNLLQGPATGFRHFAVKDINGAISGPQVRKALLEIPMAGLEKSVKDALTKQAEALLKEAESDEASAVHKAARGDDGWPMDMNDARFKAGKPPALPAFGRDELAPKYQRAMKAAEDATKKKTGT